MTWEPEGIIIHGSATPPNWMAGMGIVAQRDEITRWHTQERGWRGNGYAELYGRDGDMAIGRDLDGDGDPFDDITAHTKGWNRKAIGICLIGGHGSSANDDFYDHFTEAQYELLMRRIAYLRERFPSIKWVKGHNDFAAKACPGFNVARLMASKPPKGEGVVEFVKGSKDAKAILSTATLATVSQASNDAKRLLQNLEAMLGFNPWWIILGLVFIFWLTTRWNKWKRGVR